MGDTIILDDGIEYYVVRNELINNTIYTLFANVNDNTDVCFRKTIVQDGEEYYVGLDNENEFELVMMYFSRGILKEIDV